MIGKTILHYKIAEQLGAGGMGVVYKAEDARLSRTVALKFLQAVGTDTDRTRLMSEARAAAALDHPAICTVYGVEESEGRLFIAMQYLHGVTLDQRVAEGPLDIDESTRIIRTIAEGVQVAHGRDIIHRDIKSGNIILTDRGPVLLDFGLAKSTSGTAITQIGTTVGTPQYMSPEQARGDDVDHRTDIWSLGVVWYEMLTGRSPFTRDFASAAIYSILNDEPAAPSSHRPEIPQAIDLVVSKMLSKDVAKRYRSVNELLDDIGSSATSSQTRAHVAEEAAPSIAVLPFENMSADPEQEYFCEGIAEDVINDLTRIEGLQVVARTTSFAYKGRRGDIRSVGREIGVNTVLEGSVRKAGNRVRVTTQLVNVDTGYHMWSDRYDRDLEDVFAIQEEIARKIVDALRVELSDEEDRELATPGTTNVEAYDLFLRGRALLFRATEANHRVAQDLFTQTLGLDPNFAQAHAFLAYFYVWDSLYHQMVPDALDKAVASAERALALDENLAEGHVALGYAASVRKQYDEADRAFERALSIAPDLYEAHYYHGRSLFGRGHKERALKSFERATTVNPDDYQAGVLIGQIHREAGRDELAALSAAIAIERCKKAVRLYPEDARAVYLCAAAFLELGRNEESKEWIDRAIGLAPNDVGVMYNAACTHSRLNMGDDAVRYLDRAIELGFKEKTWIENDSDFDNIREHPGYKEILSRLG